jgi:hypothetical protein
MMLGGNDGSDFTVWNDELDRLLVAGNQGKRASDVLLEARTKAFKDGMTPADFVAQPNIPFRVWSDKGVRTARVVLWSIAGLGIAAVLISVAMMASQGNGVEEPSLQAATESQQVDPPAPARPMINFEVTAERLAKAYDENAVAANQKFKGNWVAITGVVVDVQDAPPTVRLSGDGNPRFSILNVYCEFEESYRAELAKIRTESKITIYGKVEGGSGVGSPRIVRCRLEP